MKRPTSARGHMENIQIGEDPRISGCVTSIVTLIDAYSPLVVANAVERDTCTAMKSKAPYSLHSEIPGRLRSSINMEGLYEDKT